MKKVFYALFLSVALIGTSCGDDEASTPSNIFTYDGTTYNLTSGYIEDYGANGNGSFDFDVSLVSDGITLGSDGDFSGTGDLIYLDLNTSASTGLVDGTYAWSSDRDIFTLVDGAAAINYNVTAGSGTTLEAISGSVTVDGDDISFTLTFAGGETATGSFNKMLTPF